MTIAPTSSGRLVTAAISVAALALALTGCSSSGKGLLADGTTRATITWSDFQSGQASFSGTVDGQQLTGEASRTPGECSPVVLAGNLGKSTFTIDSRTCTSPSDIHAPVLSGVIAGIAVHGSARTAGYSANSDQLYEVEGVIGGQHIRVTFGVPGGGGPFEVSPAVFQAGPLTTTATIVVTG